MRSNLFYTYWIDYGVMATLTWIKRYWQIYGKYGGGLGLIGMSDRDIGIFVFLFTQRYFEKNITFSAPQIVKQLSPLSSASPEIFKTSYSEKSVGTSLKKLVTLGFVTECKNKRRNSVSGRPAKILYETVKLTTTKKNIIDIFDSYKQTILSSIMPFEAMEETFTLKEDDFKEMQ